MLQLTRGGEMIFVGVDWAEAHHDVCVMDGEGTVLGRRKIGDSFAGVGELHAAALPSVMRKCVRMAGA